MKNRYFLMAVLFVIMSLPAFGQIEIQSFDATIPSLCEGDISPLNVAWTGGTAPLTLTFDVVDDSDNLIRNIGVETDVNASPFTLSSGYVFNIGDDEGNGQVNIRVRVEDGTPSSDESTIFVNFNPPAVVLDTDFSVCEDSQGSNSSTIDLSGYEPLIVDGVSSLTWHDNAFNVINEPEISNYPINVSETLNLEVITPMGCMQYLSITFTVEPLPFSNTPQPGDLTFYLQQTVVDFNDVGNYFNIGGADTYQWNIQTGGFGLFEGGTNFSNLEYPIFEIDPGASFPATVSFSYNITNSLTGCSYSDSFEITIVDNPDYDALAAIYSTTGGALWNNNNNWMQAGQSIDNWYGVTTALGRVTALNLSSNNLSGDMPNLYIQSVNNDFSFTELSSIDISGNNITSVQNVEWENLTALEYLYAGSNPLNEPFPLGIYELTELVDLAFENSGLSGSIENELRKLVNLESYKIALNDMSGDLFAELNLLPAFRSLEAMDNQFSGAFVLLPGALENLDFIDIRNNNISGNLPDEIWNLPLLNKLIIAGNPTLGGLISEDINNAVNLEVLAINSCAFEGVLPAINTAVPLEYIDASSNSFSGMADLSAHPLLAHLDVRQNNIPLDQLEANVLGSFDFFYTEQELPKPYPDMVTGLLGEELSIDGSMPGASNVYTWRSNGDPVSSGAILAFNSLTIADNGDYYLEVTNSMLPEISLVFDNIFIRTNPADLNGITLAVLSDAEIEVTVLFEEPLPVEINGIRIERATSEDGPFELIHTFNEPPPIYIDSNVIAGPMYYYRAYAYNNAGNSGFTEIASIAIEDQVGFNESDSLALVSFYIALNGDEWENNEGWLESNLNEWYGISTNNDFQITGLSLPNNNLVGELPETFSQLNALTTINLSTNHISRLVENSFTLLSSLDVSNNRLDFGDLESYIVVPDFEYAPQQLINIPEDTVMALGADLTLQVAVGGTANVYQWSKNSTEIEGATATNLFMETLDLADEGFYTLEIKSQVEGLEDLTLSTSAIELKISTLDRDMAALRTVYEETGGENWLVQWNINADELTNWNAGNTITVENNRVVGLDLSGNNLSGTLPTAIRELLELRSIDLSQNNITSLPNMRSLISLTALDVSENRLLYPSLIRNLSIPGFVFDNQALITVNNGENTVTVEVGDNANILVNTPGNGNAYQWFLEQEIIEGATAGNITIEDVDFEKMGRYMVEVANQQVNLLNPEFRLKSEAVQLNATTTLTGNVIDRNSNTVNEGIARLFRVRSSGAYDTIRFNGQRFVNLDGQGNFEMPDVILGDYLLFTRPGSNTYPDLLPTYFPNTIDWDLAELIAVRQKNQEATITAEGTPAELNGVAGVGGVVEEEFDDEDSRLLRRGVVQGAGVSVRTTGAVFRPGTVYHRLVDDGYQLVAYIESDEQGRFDFSNLPAGKYRFRVDLPGVPMDEASEVDFELRGVVGEELELNALVKDGVVSVERVRYLSTESVVHTELRIYPNPSHDIVSVAFEGKTIAGAKVFIYNNSGKLMKRLEFIEINNNTIQLPIGELLPGMYHLNMLTEGNDGKELKYGKLIKQ